MDDKGIPAPGQPVNVQEIREGHKSIKAAQDRIEEIMLKKIQEATKGTARYRYLVEDYEAWIQNGRPTYGQPHGKDRDAFGGSEELYDHDKHDRTAYRDMRGEHTKRLKRLRIL